MIYSMDKLMAEARKLAADYRRATGRPLAISGEIARHDAARLLDLELNDKPEAGYDALGRGAREGRRILIKGRAIFDESKSGQRIGQLKVEAPWDSVVLVLMDEHFEPSEIYEADRETVLAAVDETSARAKRGPLSVAKFKAIGSLAWTREEGRVDETPWENHPPEAP